MNPEKIDEIVRNEIDDALIRVVRNRALNSLRRQKAEINQHTVEAAVEYQVKEIMTRLEKAIDEPDLVVKAGN